MQGTRDRKGREGEREIIMMRMNRRRGAKRLLREHERKGIDKEGREDGFRSLLERKQMTKGEASHHHRS